MALFIHLCPTCRPKVTKQCIMVMISALADITAEGLTRTETKNSTPVVVEMKVHVEAAVVVMENTVEIIGDLAITRATVTMIITGTKIMP